MQSLYKTKLLIGCFLAVAGAIFFIATSAQAACNDNVDQSSSIAVSRLRPCSAKTDAQQKADCIQFTYQELCVENISATNANYQTVCQQEAQDCAQAYKNAVSGDSSGTDSASGSSDNTSVSGSGNCGTDFDNVNGVCVPKSDFPGGGVAGSKNWQELVVRIIKIFMTLAGVIAVVAIIIGGFQYMTSGGNEEQAEKGRKVLINSVIGLILVILAYTIVTVITNTVTKQ